MSQAGIAFLILQFFLTAGLAAEAPEVQEIKRLYRETAAAINLAQKGEAGGLYCNELTINSRNGSWRAVGNYLKKVAFWYGDQPEFAMAEGRSPEAALVKVEVLETAAASSLYREFYFAGGELVFFFSSEKNGDGTADEKRIYFKDGKPLLRVHGSEAAPGPGDSSRVFREASRWQKFFLLSFGD